MATCSLSLFSMPALFCRWYNTKLRKKSEFWPGDGTRLKGLGIAIHPVGNMNVCNKLHGNPSNSWMDGGATGKVIRPHPLGTMNICTKCHGKPPCGYTRWKIGVIIVRRIDPRGNREWLTKLHDNLTKSCWTISVWNKMVDQQAVRQTGPPLPSIGPRMQTWLKTPSQTHSCKTNWHIFMTKIQ